MTAVSACYSREEVSVSKHRIAILELSGDFNARKVKRLRRQKTLPLVAVTIGPSPMPPSWEGFKTKAVDAKAPEDVDALFGEFRSKALSELAQVLHIEEDLSRLARPPTMITVGAAQPCAGYLTKPNVAATWRHLQAKTSSLADAIDRGLRRSTCCVGASGERC